MLCMISDMRKKVEFHESKELLKLMAEEVNNNVFSRYEKIIDIIHRKVCTKFGRNKLKNWRLRLEPAKELDDVGIGWDRVPMKFIATNEIWENLKKVHLKLAALHNKIFEDYDELKLVIDNYYPRGKEATVLRLCSVDRVTPVTDKKRDSTKVAEGATHVMTPSPYTDDTPMSISQGFTSPMSSSSTATTRPRRTTWTTSC